MPMEDNIWESNDNPHLAEAEDEFTSILIKSSTDSIADLMSALGLEMKGELQKSWLKKIQKRITPSNLQKMLDYAKNAGKAWTVKQLELMDHVLQAKLPNWYTVAEQFMTQVAALGKIRKELHDRDIGMDEVVLKQLPEKLEDASTKAIIFQVKQGSDPIEIPPFSIQETTTLANAVTHCADKVQDVTSRQHAAIRELVIQAMKEKWTTSQLTQELLHKTGDYQRDWRRVALTEIAFATNDAYLDSCEEGAIVFVPTIAGSCKYCQSLLEGKTFKVLSDPPKKPNHDTEMNHVWSGKTNYGRRVSEYIPAVPLHPFCRHRYQRLSMFYKIVDGKVVRKTREELQKETGITKSFTQGGEDMKYTQEDCKKDTLEHINQVREFMRSSMDELQKRSNEHDQSKLKSPELEIFTEYTPKLENSTYGSSDYKTYLKEMDVALQHHYANNSHHPEHYDTGVSGMNLFDVLEMVCDWKAAVMRRADGDIYKSLEINKERFGINDQLYNILKNTIEHFEKEKL